MIAKRRSPENYRSWNTEWNAPFGRALPKRLLPASMAKSRLVRRYAGPFAEQPNNDTRAIEYPWAFFQSEVRAGQKVLDLGGGFSGFAFVLAKNGVDCTVVDPLLDYGPDAHYNLSPKAYFADMCSAHGCSPKLVVSDLPSAKLPKQAFDHIFCISVLEHLPQDDLVKTLGCIRELLKPGGQLVASVDLFLDLKPFTTRPTNEFGCNQSIRKIVETSELELCFGKTAELYGYPDFDADTIQQQLFEYYIGSGYPALASLFIPLANEFSCLRAA